MEPRAGDDRVPAQLGRVELRDVLQFEKQGWSAFAQRFAGLDLLQGRKVSLSDGRVGQACGVTASGALRLQTAAGLVEVASGEVSVRPQD